MVSKMSPREWYNNTLYEVIDAEFEVQSLKVKVETSLGMWHMHTADVVFFIYANW